MKPIRTLSFIPMIYGIIVTSLMLLIFGSALILSVIEKGIVELTEIIRALVHWYDDPTGFFFTYIIGYAIVWWKPLWGSVIIMLGSLLVTVININNLGFLIFAIPTFLVGFFYLYRVLVCYKKEE
jgi:hypothetical protein